MDRSFMQINTATEEKELDVYLSGDGTVEDLCIKVCRKFRIGPVARHLFALRGHSSKLWLSSDYKIQVKEKDGYDFRLRFKPANVERLKEIDENAYDYYFQQARLDVLNNKVPDIIYEKHKRELIGLGVSDMYRVMLEKGVSQEIVESDYKKYIPKECIRRHAFFIKKPIHNALRRLSGHNASYVKEQYLKQLEYMAPNYPYEEYKALMDKGGSNPPVKVLLRVNVGEVKYCEGDYGEWKLLCAIEDLCFISIREDNTVEISRKNGIPKYLKFEKKALLISFVSALDGYYRLSIKWTFNLCREIITPSLERLHKLKCHGPVGEEFSYAKLKEKRDSKPGTYILRESETKYDTYYIDFCEKGGKLSSRIVQVGLENVYLIGNDTNDEQRYKSMGQLISSFQDPKESLYLAECLPPSEYDISPLLICASENVGNDVAADEKIIASLLEGGSRCVPQNQLQVYKAFDNEENLVSPHVRMSATTLHRAMWQVAKGKKLEVAIKILKEEERSYFTREFLELADKWGKLRSGALVRLYGITLAPSIGMLFELVKLGPLDKYLMNSSPQTVKIVDMVEATACLAKALWHLEECGVVHGNIRCNKLLVHAHTDNSFIIKLADPGLFTNIEVDIHWIPPECYANPELAKRSFQADIWAVATTIWQIFSRGSLPYIHSNINIVKKFYQCGQRLPSPSGCPNEIYQLMLACWGENSISRKQPQAIMRDINQFLYQFYNSRRTHTYATAFPKLFKNTDRIDEDDSNTVESKSLNGESHTSSAYTDHTSLGWDDIDEATTGVVKHHDDYIDSTDKLSAYFDMLGDVNCGLSSGNGINPNEHAMHNLRLTRRGSHNDTLTNGNTCDNDGVVDRNSSCSFGHIFELDADCNVILQGRIGQGFYGEVYRGTLEKENNESQQVAIKKLKTWALEADLRDFEREISIMKTLKHPNVVEILGVISEPEVCLVMEFVKNGSLQSYLAIHRETLTHKRLLGFALDIATGMDYLGYKNIVHRDLAARNILVADEDRVKISDFGLAQVMGKNDYYILQTNRDLPIKWYAPESLRDGKFSPRSDVWSFGVTMYETFAFGEDPKLPDISIDHKSNHDGSEIGIEEDGGSELLSALERGVRLPCPPTCPQTVYVNLMYPCWHLKSHERPDFATLCQEIKQLLTDY